MDNISDKKAGQFCEHSDHAVVITNQSVLEAKRVMLGGVFIAHAMVVLTRHSQDIPEFEEVLNTYNRYKES